MKKFTRIICLLMSAVMMITFAACGGKKSDKNNDSNTATTKSKYAGTTVRYATWKDPDLNEDGPVIKEFEKKTGIKVQVDLIEQGTYINEITGLIAAGNAPDIFFSNMDFPACLSCLQPLTAAGLDYEDDIWDKTILNMTTFKGEPYLCNTIGNIWNEIDCVFYNKSLLQQANCYTPEEYADAGKWTWDAFGEIMAAVNDLDGCIGGAIFSVDSLTSSAGCSIYTLKDGKFISGIEDTVNRNKLVECYRKISNWSYEGILKWNWREDFISGKVGIVVTNVYGLKKTGYYAQMNWNDIGFWYLPDYDENTPAIPTGIFRGWGIIRGAKNPLAAGEFLRYYLDSGNYNTTDAFISSDAEAFYFEVTGNGAEGSNPYYTFSDTIDAIAGFDAQVVFGIPASYTASQVAAQVEAKKNSVKAAVNSINAFVDQNTGVK